MHHARKDVNGLPGAPRDHRVHEREAERSLTTMERKQKHDGRDTRIFWEKLLQEVMVLEDRTWAVFEIRADTKEQSQRAEGLGCCWRWRHLEGGI